MGFIFCDEQRVNINLSTSAWNVIRQDISDFSAHNKKLSNLSGILNTIFLNFFEKANHSFSLRIEERTKELYDNVFLKIPNFEFRILKIELHNYLTSLYQKSIIIEKGEAKKIRINDQNREYLEISEDNKYYNNCLSLYLKNIYEEYSLLPLSKREDILFKDNIDIIDKAINEYKRIKIFYLDNTSYIVSPYKIQKSKEGLFSYLIAIDEKGNIIRNRVSRLINIIITKTDKRKISKEKSIEIEKLLSKGSQFISEDIKEIKIKIDDKGKAQFRDSLINRPQSVSIEGDIFTFTCTEQQILYYFFRFGKHVEILSPINLREKFKKLYKEAYEIYK